jgi:predicted transposase YdaD
MEKGFAQGMETANLENARRMKADNMPVELIAKYTGLSIEMINSL